MRILLVGLLAYSLSILGSGCVPPPGDDPAAVAAKGTDPRAADKGTSGVGSDQPPPDMVGANLGKEDYVAVMADLACVDQHFAEDEAAKTAARVTVLEKAGGSDDWLAFVAADLEMEGLTDPMTQKVADASRARCPEGTLPDDMLDPEGDRSATEDKIDADDKREKDAPAGDATPAGDAKDDPVPSDDPK
jgi:hypothetical protein